MGRQFVAGGVEGCFDIHTAEGSTGDDGLVPDRALRVPCISAFVAGENCSREVRSLPTLLRLRAQAGLCFAETCVAASLISVVIRAPRKRDVTC